MEKKGSMTIYLTLMLSLILSLVCTSINSVQMACARTQILNGIDIGLYSLFGQYDQDLLKNYDLFLLDGSCGGGDLKPGTIYKSMESYMKPVLKQNSQKLSIEQGGLTGYQLVTDENGEVFYHQVVQYMKETLGSRGVQLLMNQMSDRKRKTEKAKQDGQKLENGSSLDSYESEMNRASKNSEEALERAKKAAEEQAELTGQPVAVITPKPVRVTNPITTIKRIMRMDILYLVLPSGKMISNASVSAPTLVSRRKLQTGMGITFPVKKDTSYTSQILFQQYLMEKLGNYTNDTNPAKTGLHYQTEYLIKGKYRDMDNLRAVAKELLLIREGVNVASLLGDPAKRAAVSSLALGIASTFLIPPAAGVIEGALILCWAFAESVLDVRELFDGGRVPLVKSASDWQTSLENLPSLLSRMDDMRKNVPNGLSYEDYLQVLLLGQSKQRKIWRGMDMVEVSLREATGRTTFQMDSCITALEASVDVKANRRKMYTVTRQYCYG